MKIHGDIAATPETVIAVMTELRMQGKIAPDLRVEFSVRGSRSRRHALDIRLVCPTMREGEKRRHADRYGRNFGAAHEYGGTWQEWGWILAALFEADDSLTVPGIYADGWDFHDLTDDVFGDVHHVTIKATELERGDLWIAGNRTGTGVRVVRSVTSNGPGKATIRYTDGNRSGWVRDENVTSKRAAIVARQIGEEA